MDKAITKSLQGSLSPASEVAHNHFSVKGQPLQQQLLAWRERVGHVIDVLPSLTQVETPFNACIDRYDIGARRFTDCRSDALLLERSVARISTDNHRDYVFHVFTHGGIESIEGISLPLRKHPSASIIALDLNQPVRMHRGTCRMLTLFVPRATVDAAFPHAESIHGRMIENTSPLAQLLIEHVEALSKSLHRMSANEAATAFDISVHLLLGAFGKQTKLSGNARSAVLAGMFDKARRYVQANLHRGTLTPETLFQTLKLPRSTLYRLFEQEGGLGAYIRNCRLREAVDELVSFPNLPVAGIAYGLGFKSASDFTRAFRRAYGMAPQDLRFMALQRLRQEAPAGLSAILLDYRENATMQTG